MLTLKIASMFVGTVITYLTVIIFFPIMKVEEQPFQKKLTKEDQEIPPMREDVTFKSEGINISGWLYLPEDLERPAPCLVISTGFGGTKDGFLEKYALKFVNEGYGVLTYDYRHYGESGGMPRQILSVREQLDDLRAAIDFVRSREEFDPDKVILWGTSAGANYGIVIAGEDKSIAGVIAQCGAFDHKEDSKLGIEREGYGFYIRMFIHGQRDKGRGRFGLSRHMIPPYGRPGTTSFLRTPGTFEGAERLGLESEYFKNEVCAGFMLMPRGPNPLKCAEHVVCPVQILVCEKDEIISPKSHVRLAKILGDKASVITYPIGHFDIYEGEHFERAVEDQMKFIRTILG